MSMTEPGRMGILMVCMGNICRSPTAEAVLRGKLERAGLHERVLVDSAGTHAYHVGNPPDERAQEHAQRRGYDLSALRARKVGRHDFERFHWLLAMDGDNLRELHDVAPPHLRDKARLLMSFAEAGAVTEVPDPYYGGDAGFERVLDLVETACDGLVHLMTLQFKVKP